MDGTPALIKFGDDVRYLRDHVYNNDMEDIDKRDPRKDDGTKWTKMIESLSKLPYGSLKIAVMQTFRDIAAVRPSSIADGRILLENMQTTIQSVLQCLKLHPHKGDGSDTSSYDPSSSLKPTLQTLEARHLENKIGFQSEHSPLLTAEKHFYQLRGKEFLTKEKLMALLKSGTHFGRIAMINQSNYVGHFVCKVRQDVLEVVDWATVVRDDLHLQGLPEALAAELLSYASPHNQRKPRASCITYGIEDLHPEKVVAPAAEESTNGRRYFL